MTKHRVVLEIDDTQLGILLSQIEGMFQRSSGLNDERCEATLDAEIDLASAHWKPGQDDGSYAFDIVKLAPIYRTLLQAWSPRRGEIKNIYECDDVFEFVTALREARKDAGTVADSGSASER